MKRIPPSIPGLVENYGNKWHECPFCELPTASITYTVNMPTLIQVHFVCEFCQNTGRLDAEVTAEATRKIGYRDLAEALFPDLRRHLANEVERYWGGLDSPQRRKWREKLAPIRQLQSAASCGDPAVGEQ